MDDWEFVHLIVTCSNVPQNRHDCLFLFGSGWALVCDVVMSGNLRVSYLKGSASGGLSEKHHESSSQYVISVPRNVNSDCGASLWKVLPVAIRVPGDIVPCGLQLNYRTIGPCPSEWLVAE